MLRVLTVELLFFQKEVSEKNFLTPFFLCSLLLSWAAFGQVQWWGWSPGATEGLQAPPAQVLGLQTIQSLPTQPALRLLLPVSAHQLPGTPRPAQPGTRQQSQEQRCQVSLESD